MFSTTTPPLEASKDTGTGRYLAFWPFLIALLTAWIIRGFIYTGVEFMPKINGAYYLVQARAILETGHTGIPDLPLLFYIHAGVAKLLMWLHFGNTEACITMAVKAMDTLLPPLTAIPVYFLARDWLGDRKQAWLPALAAGLFTVLNGSTFMMLSDFQKNAFGMIWMLGFILAVHRAGQEMTWKRLAWVGILLLLAGMTHIGVFGATASFAALAVLSYMALMPEHRRKLIVVLGIGVVMLAAMLIVVKLGFDPKRAEHFTGLIEAPLKLFKTYEGGPGGMMRPPAGMPRLPQDGPAGMMRGGPPGGMGMIATQIGQSVIIHGLSLLTLILLMRNWRSITSADKAIVIAAMLTALFLVSPFLDMDHGMRFGLMAYAPGVVLLLFSLSRWKSVTGTAILSVIIIAYTIGTLAVSPPMANQTTVSAEAMPELASLKQYITRPEKTLIVASHGLEWWVAWTLKTKIAHGNAVTDADTQKYEHVLYIRQTGGRGMMAPGGPTPGLPPMNTQNGPKQNGGPPRERGDDKDKARARGGMPFMQVELPENSRILFKGNYFTLAEGPNEEEKKAEAIEQLFKPEPLPF